VKILIICYCFPPDRGPRAYRWDSISAHWAAQGHEVHVVSGCKPGAAREEIRNGVHVHRAGGAFTDNLRSWIERRRGSVDTPPGQPLSSEAVGGVQFSASMRILKRVHDLTWKKVYWPESTCLWFFPAWRKTRRLLREIAFDAIVSSSTPYTGHLVGHAAKKRAPRAHWMVDIGDPFSFCPAPTWNNEALYKRLNHRSERGVLRDADSVSMTVQTCIDEYARIFPDLDIREKTVVIPPLLARRPPEAENGADPGARRRLVFTGTLYKDIRHPGYLLRLLASVRAQRPETEMHFYGRVNDCLEVFEPYREQIGKTLFLHGPVGRDEALKKIAEADILVNLGNATTYQLPSKIVDYASTGRPILNLITEAEDSSLAVLGDYPAHLPLREREDGPSAEEVARVVRFIEERPSVPASFLTSFIGQFGVEAVSEAYLSTLADPAQQ